MQPTFRPWLRDTRRGHVYLASSLGILLWAWQQFSKADSTVGFILLATGFLALRQAVTHYRRAVWRRHGQAFETSALATAVAPPGWSLERDIRHPRLGNIDAHITRPDGAHFTVELKSWECLTYDTKGRLVKCNGHPPRKDPIPQCRQQGRVMHATPILWLPKGKGQSFLIDEVLVVHGNFDTLIHVLSRLS